MTISDQSSGSERVPGVLASRISSSNRCSCVSISGVLRTLSRMSLWYSRPEKGEIRSSAADEAPEETSDNAPTDPSPLRAVRRDREVPFFIAHLQFGLIVSIFSVRISLDQ